MTLCHKGQRASFSHLCLAIASMESSSPDAVLDPHTNIRHAASFDGQSLTAQEVPLEISVVECSGIESILEIAP
jgi:hypothetical protein